MGKVVDPISGRGLRFKDRAGTRNGRLAFTRIVGKTRYNHYIWEARCDCGAITQTTTPQATKSCGCILREICGARFRARRQENPVSRTKEYRSALRKRLREDPAKAMHERISRLFAHAMKQVGGIKSSPTLEALGYTADELRRHMERQFLDGMSWGNRAEWQIDHIVPISEAQTEADVVRLNQLANLRPAWAEDNNAKRARRVTLL